MESDTVEVHTRQSIPITEMQEVSIGLVGILGEQSGSTVVRDFFSNWGLSGQASSLSSRLSREYSTLAHSMHDDVTPYTGLSETVAFQMLGLLGRAWSIFSASRVECRSQPSPITPEFLFRYGGTVRRASTR